MIWLSSAMAATLVVDPSVGPYTDIASALEVAVDGDTLELSADTFAECIDAGKSITLQGQAGTVLDGSGLCDNTLVVDDGETVVVQDLEMVNDGARSATMTSSTLSFEGVRFTGGNEAWAGGAIHTYGGTLNTTDCVFSELTGSYGGAIYLYAYGAWNDSGSLFESNHGVSGGGGVYSYYDNDVSLVGTQFHSNDSGGQAGGMWHGWYGELSLDGVDFQDNVAVGSGGGLMIYAVDSVIPITDSSFADNTSTEGHAGAIEMEWYADLEIRDSSFTNNSAPLNSGGALASWYYAHVSVTDSHFEGNSSLYGGAIRHYPYEGKAWDLNVTGSTFVDNSALSGGAIRTEWPLSVSLSDNHFEGNAATEGNGGAVQVYVAGSVELHHNRFCASTASNVGGAVDLEWVEADASWNNAWIDNSAPYGGALYRYQAKVGSITHETFVGNSAEEEGGAYFASAGYADFHSNLVAHTGSGAGLYTADAHSVVNSSVSHSGWADNQAVHAGGYWWITDGEDGNVVAEDPGFVDYDGCQSDLRLRGDSPFRDIGQGEDLDGSVSDAGSSGGAEAPLEDADADGYDTSEDCDDTRDDVHPGVAEICNGLDDDCSGEVDDDPVDQGTWYMDADGDGWGNSPLRACEQPEGSVDEDGDCDDLDAAIFPGADEVLDDGVDQDCDGSDAESEPEPEGCGGCSSGSSPAGAGLVLLLLALAARRRR
jgi:MYXO-CTERM domain-containing protein